MLKLIEINEPNYPAFAALTVREDQRAFLDTAAGILARGYVYRACRARVIGFADGARPIGIALVKDLDEEPACYDLQQFMIDRRYQGRGYGTEALRLILTLLQKERRYDCVELCVKKENAAALRFFEAASFRDTGYVDAGAPDCLNLRLRFPDLAPGCSDALLADFSDPLFQAAFRTYFSELGIGVRDWDGLFREMTEGGGNEAFVRTGGDGGVIGFVQLAPICFTSWFFEETCGFVREFWVAAEHRGRGHGAALLRLAEDHFRRQGFGMAILTTDKAEGFYLRHGYHRAPGCRAKNGDAVMIKQLA